MPIVTSPVGTIVLIVVAWVAAIVGLTIFIRAWLIRRRMQQRMFVSEGSDILVDEDTQGRLSYWLYVAGYRSPKAAVMFVVLTIVFVIIGGALALATYFAGAVNNLVLLLAAVPGGVGEVLIPLAYASPFILVFMLGMLPWLVVTNARRRRVNEFEQDLPLMLDLLSTLAQAGLGFDTAVDRVLDTLPPERAMVQEFRSFQRDTLAGRARVDALRRLGRRVNLTWFSAFISAVVQAEQIGAGLAQVLQTQADDLRDRRREQALAMAMQIPVKLLLPLIACFFPGLAVAVIGPTFFGLFQFLSTFTRSVGS